MASDEAARDEALRRLVAAVEPIPSVVAVSLGACGDDDGCDGDCETAWVHLASCDMEAMDRIAQADLAINDTSDYRLSVRCAWSGSPNGRLAWSRENAASEDAPRETTP